MVSCYVFRFPGRGHREKIVDCIYSTANSVLVFKVQAHMYGKLKLVERYQGVNGVYRPERWYRRLYVVGTDNEWVEWLRRSFQSCFG